MTTARKVRIIGVPYCYGKDSEALSYAPKTLRESGLYGALAIAKIPFEDIGDIGVGKTQITDAMKQSKLKHLPEVMSIAKGLSNKVEKILKAGEFPIVLGGDHSIAIGSLMGVANFDQDVTIIWIDSHGDFHTSETTPSGRLHGMALALGLGLDDAFSRFFSSPVKFCTQAILFAAHKFDPGEREAVEAHIPLIDMSFVVQYGIGKAVEKLLEQIKTKRIYISLDLDSIDKLYAPGTDMAIDGALTYRELIYLLETLAACKEVVGIDLVELEPENDIDQKTVNLSIESITAALGNRIGAYELYMDALEPVG